MRRAIVRVRLYGELVMFSHSLFSFSFLAFSALAARQGLPTLREVALLALAFLGARTAANAFNRVVDRRFDAANPRTKDRHLVAQTVSVREALALCLLSLAVLAVAAGLLRPLCLYLLPAAGLLILGYSYTKRFTWLCHGVLGVACSAASAGAWIALSGSLPLPALAICCANALWVAGFDIVYAVRDIDFDRQWGLHSIPARFGKRPALLLAAVAHGGAVCSLILAAYWLDAGWVLYSGIAAIAALLATSSLLAWNDYVRFADFCAYTSNKLVSLILLGAAFGEYLL